MNGPRPVLLVKSGGAAALPEWQAHFREFRPELEVRWWDDPATRPERVRYVLVWEPEPGRLARYANLRVIFSTAAGVDHILRDPHLPPGIPIVRMASEETAQTMGEYVCLATLAILRDLPRIIAARAECRWDNFDAPRTARETRVGVMGFGHIGQTAARMLAGLGFPVHGWARTRKTFDQVEIFAGEPELAAFLRKTDILVGLLPKTPETRGLIDARRIALLPRGAGLVNAGRGSLVVLPDLLAALDSGQLGAAVLDVFEPEPLPSGHPAWRHPRLLVTPHLAGYAARRARAHYVATALAAFERGDVVPHLYDPVRGY